MAVTSYSVGYMSPAKAEGYNYYVAPGQCHFYGNISRSSRPGPDDGPRAEIVSDCAYSARG